MSHNSFRIFFIADALISSSDIHEKSFILRIGQTDLKMVLTPFVLQPEKTFIFQLNFFKKCTFDNYTVYILHSNINTSHAFLDYIPSTYSSTIQIKIIHHCERKFLMRSRTKTLEIK